MRNLTVCRVFWCQKKFDSKFWRIKTRLIFFDNSSNFWCVCGRLSKFWSNFSFSGWLPRRKDCYMLEILIMYHVANFVSSLKLNRSHQNDLKNIYKHFAWSQNRVNKQNSVFILEMYMSCRYVFIVMKLHALCWVSKKEFKLFNDSHH